MKVLYVLAHFPQNSEAYVSTEMSYVVRRGIRIEVWSPQTGYGDTSEFLVHRRSLGEAIASFKPDVIHIHHMTTASYYINQLPKDRSTTIRSHSFDWDDGLAAKLVKNPAVARVFAFPHFASRVVGVEPMSVAFDQTIYKPMKKDRFSVVRLAAGLPTKRLEDFIEVGNRLAGVGRFTLAINLVRGRESLVVDAMNSVNKSFGGNVKIRVNLTREDTAALVGEAAVYLSTCDVKSHPFGMPISIAEAMGTGAVPVARRTPGAMELVGSDSLLYGSIDDAVRIVRHMLECEVDWKIQSDVALQRSEQYRSDMVLPRLIDEWAAICLKKG